MQLVLSGNKIIAYGEDCFLSMGSTVVCSKTGKAYQNATVVNECGEIPCDIDKVGYEYHAGVFVPCAPYGIDENGYIMTACKECATPKNSGIDIKTVLRASIAVTAPAGSSVTAKQGETVLSANEINGVWVFYPTAFGTWEITATLDENTVTGKVEINAVRPYAITLIYTDTVLANNSWSTISEIAKTGHAEEFWSIGDEKTFILDGTTYTAQIIGFNHDEVENSEEYGSGTAGITFQLKNCLNALSTGSAQDWVNSELRTKITGLLTLAESDLTECIVPVKKYYQSSGGELLNTVDRAFLLSEYEVHGSRTFASTYNEGAQYEFYSAGNSYVKTVNGTAEKWWLRTLSKETTDGITVTNGVVVADSANSKASKVSVSSQYGVAFAFCL